VSPLRESRVKSDARGLIALARDQKHGESVETSTMALSSRDGMSKMGCALVCVALEGAWWGEADAKVQPQRPPQFVKVSCRNLRTNQGDGSLR
jgi:hypothetical protein